MELCDIGRVEIPLPTRRIHGEAQRMRSPDIAQTSVDDLSITQQHDRLARVDLRLRIRRQWADDKFHRRHLAGRKLPILTVDPKNESTSSHVDELTTWSLTVLQRESCRFLGSNGQSCDQTEQSDSNGCESFS